MCSPDCYFPLLHHARLCLVLATSHCHQRTTPSNHSSISHSRCSQVGSTPSLHLVLGAAMKLHGRVGSSLQTGPGLDVTSSTSLEWPCSLLAGTSLVAGARVCTGAPATGFSHGACDQNAPGVIVTPGAIATAGPAPPGLSGTDVASLGHSVMIRRPVEWVPVHPAKTECRVKEECWARRANHSEVH